ncbi:hypothetical protein ACEPAH_2730 [Sanghuangporus vaninii]
MSSALHFARRPSLGVVFHTPNATNTAPAFDSFFLPVDASINGFSSSHPSTGCDEVEPIAATTPLPKSRRHFQLCTCGRSMKLSLSHSTFCIGSEVCYQCSLLALLSYVHNVGMIVLHRCEWAFVSPSRFDPGLSLRVKHGELSKDLTVLPVFRTTLESDDTVYARLSKLPHIVSNRVSDFLSGCEFAASFWKIPEEQRQIIKPESDVSDNSLAVMCASQNEPEIAV